MTQRTSEIDAAEYETMARVEDEHWWYRSLRGLVLRSLEDLRSPGSLVLDAGCGTGRGVLAWARAGSAVGLDISSEALRHARRRGARPLVRASIEVLPFRDGSFDAVVSLDVISHEGVSEDRALSELFRVLRPGGILILNLPAFTELRGVHDVAARIRHRYRKGEAVAMLRAAGFDIARCGYWNTALYPVVWAIRRLRRGGAGMPASSDIARLPTALNAVLVGLLRLETRLFGGRAPFGTSVFAVGRRPLR